VAATDAAVIVALAVTARRKAGAAGFGD